VAQAFAVPHHFAFADGEYGAEAAVSAQPVVVGVQESETSCLHLDYRDVGEPAVAERGQVRALDRTGRAHRDPLHQLIHRDAHVQELGERRHHLGAR
jgi:hypothetical protein